MARAGKKLALKSHGEGKVGAKKPWNCGLISPEDSSHHFLLTASAGASAPALSGQGTLFDSFFTSKQFQDQLHAAVLSLLRTPEGEELIAKVVRKELLKQR